MMQFRQTGRADVSPVNAGQMSIVGGPWKDEELESAGALNSAY